MECAAISFNFIRLFKRRDPRIRPEDDNGVGVNNISEHKKGTIIYEFS